MIDRTAIESQIEAGTARLDQLNTELANVDDKIREREALVAQLDWLQSFPGLGDDLTPHIEAVDKAIEAIVAETATPEIEAPAPEADIVEIPTDRESLRKMKLPELKALAKQEGIDVTGNKADIVETLFEELIGSDDEEDEAPEDSGIPEGFTPNEAAPAPTEQEAAPAPAAPAPQTGKSPFTF